MSIDFLAKKYDCKQIDVLLYNNDIISKEWFCFFKINYKNTVKLNQIHEITGMYDTMFYLTSTDYKPNIDSAHKNFCLVHQSDKICLYKNMYNLTICPFIKNCELIPYKFNLTMQKPQSSSFYPDVNFFVTGWQEHLDLEVLNTLLEKQDIKCLYISKRYETHQAYSNLIFCERISTIQLIDCFFHKTCIFIPKKTSAYMDERISGCIHLCASFGTPLFLPYILNKIYSNNNDNFYSYDRIYE
jgi:hypothetical protein